MRARVCVCTHKCVWDYFFFPPVSRVVFLEGCGSNHSTMYRAFFCIKKKKFTLSINVIILCTDLGSWPCFAGGDDAHLRDGDRGRFLHLLVYEEDGELSEHDSHGGSEKYPKV